MTVQEAIDKLLLICPAYYYLISSMDIEEDARCPSMGVSVEGLRIKLRYNKEFVDKLNDKELMFVLQHEAQHIFREHVTALVADEEHKYNPQLANIAMDLIINESLPVKTLRRKMRKDMILNDNLIKAGWIDAPIDTQSKTWQEVYAILHKEGKDKAGEMKSLDDHSNFDKPGKSQQQKAVVQKAIEDAVKDAKAKGSASGKQWGDVPGDLKRKFEKVAAAQVNWPKILKIFSQSALTESFEKSWTRPNRRFGFKYKGNKRQYQPKLLVAIDNSGSIDENIYNLFMTHIGRIAKIMGEIPVVACDTSINFEGIVKGRGGIPYDQIGCGGGTAFWPVFDYAKKKGYNNLIYFTDGFAEMPSKRYNINTLLVLPKQEHEKHKGARIKNLVLE